MNLPQRTKTHILENVSEQFLISCLPKEWVLRKLSPDYGLDYTIETFDYSAEKDSFLPTGIRFTVQLKSTERVECVDSFIKHQIEVKTLNYLSSYNDPPFIALYISREPEYDSGQLFYLFVKPFIAVLDTVRPKWRGQKNTDLQFPVENNFDRKIKEIYKCVSNDTFLLIEEIKYLRYFKGNAKTQRLIELFKAVSNTIVIKELLNSIQPNDKKSEKFFSYVVKYVEHKNYYVHKHAIIALKWFVNPKSIDVFCLCWQNFSQWWLALEEEDIFPRKKLHECGRTLHNEILDEYVLTAATLGDGIDSRITKILLVEFLNYSEGVSLYAGDLLIDYIKKCDSSNKVYIEEEIDRFINTRPELTSKRGLDLKTKIAEIKHYLVYYYS